MIITNLKTLKKIINNEFFDNIFFAVTFPKDAFSLESIFPLKIVSFDSHPITKLIKPQANIFSLTANTKDQPKRRSTSVLLKHPATIKYISSFNQSQPNILVYKPSPSLEKICAKNRWQLLANPAYLNREIENKINFSQILDKLDLPQPKYQVEKLFNIDYTFCAQKYGSEFFIQFPRGFAGSSTFLINSPIKLQEIKDRYLNYPTKISQKISGPTYSLNACIVNNTVNKRKIIIQPPFYQITNLPDLNSSAGGTCGNIYSNNLSAIKNLPQLFADTTKFGEYLYQKNYRGIFGLDFVIDQKTGQYYFIECNPRLTASIPMITKLQIKNNQIPILALHIMEMLKFDYQISDDVIDNIQSKPVIGSQIISRNIKSEPINPPITFDSGIYSTTQKFTNIIDLKNILLKQPQSLQYLRPGKDILDLKKEAEFLILSEPQDHSIAPNIEYLRIQSLI